jgi:predicted ATPase
VAGLHGRAVEAGVLGEALDVLASGRRAIILVEGEAGIGKTRLLTDTLDHAGGRGFQVSVGRGEELERTRPFGVVAGAFECARSSPDPRRAAIATLLTTHGVAAQGPITVTSDPGLLFRAVDAFVDLVEELALRAPLVIGLDDLQWADPSSLLTVSALARRLTGLPLALICCFRPSPRVPQLERAVDALRAAGAWQLTLRQLAQDAVTALVSEAVGAEPGPGLLREIAGAGGNPLFVTELLSAMRQEGLLLTTDGRVEVAAMTLPPTLRLTILRGLSFLPEETLQALRSASILGRSFTLTELSMSTARTALNLSVALAEAIAAGVLADDDTRLRFRHDLIRDAIYEDLPGSVRLALHREAGQRLADAGAPAAQVAEHLARGAIPGDVSAIEWLARAAREAASRSPDVAADLLGRAITLMDPTDPARDRPGTTESRAHHQLGWRTSAAIALWGRGCSFSAAKPRVVARVLSCRWFSGLPAELEQAKAHCRECSVRSRCLARAVERRAPYGTRDLPRGCDHRARETVRAPTGRITRVPGGGAYFPSRHAAGNERTSPKKRSRVNRPRA